MWEIHPGTWRMIGSIQSVWIMLTVLETTKFQSQGFWMGACKKPLLMEQLVVSLRKGTRWWWFIIYTFLGSFRYRKTRNATLTWRMFERMMRDVWQLSLNIQGLGANKKRTEWWCVGKKQKAPQFHGVLGKLEPMEIKAFWTENNHLRLWMLSSWRTLEKPHAIGESIQ